MRTADLTTQARIRSAALDHFADHGVAGSSVRSIASGAGVSPALIGHHFGSKDGLREAVDEYVVEVIAEIVDDFAQQGPGVDTSEVFRQLSDQPALLSYLYRSLAEGGAAGESLFDRMMDLSVAAFQDMAASGLVRPVDDLPAVALFVLSGEFGVMLMRAHVQRYFGFDPLSPEGIQRWMGAELELFRGGLFIDEE